jgi:hypothetical protein
VEELGKSTENFMMAGVLAEIRSRYLLKANQKRYVVSQFCQYQL